MTKYSSLKSFNGKSKFHRSTLRKQYGKGQKWRSFAGVFIVIILVFATINGLFKSIAITKYLGESFDNNSSFVAVLTTSPTSIFIYQNDPRRMVFLTVPEVLYCASGKFSEAIERIGEVAKRGDGQELLRMATLNFGTSIEKYAIFRDVQITNKDQGEKLFKNFASIATPIAIMTGLDDVETNITRGELFSLWWQIKTLSVDQLKLVDLADFGEEVLAFSDQKVMGADAQSFNREIKEYLENRKVVDAGLKVKIQNASGITLSLGLAADIVSSIGFDVVEVDNAETRS